jgi:hypothetical protein
MGGKTLDYRAVSWESIKDDVVLDLFLFLPLATSSHPHERFDVDTFLPDTTPRSNYGLAR